MCCKCCRSDRLAGDWPAYRFASPRPSHTAPSRPQAELSAVQERLTIAQSGVEQVNTALAAARKGGLQMLAQLATANTADEQQVSPSFQGYLRKLLQLPSPARGR